METNNKTPKKANTPALGAESNATSTEAAKLDTNVNGNEGLFGKDETSDPEPDDIKTDAIPDWVKDLMRSNELLIDSNRKLTELIESLVSTFELLKESNEKGITSNDNVLEGIDSFKESAGEMILAAVKEFTSKGNPKETVKKEVLEIDPDANYIAVAKIKVGHTEFKHGDNVDHLEKGQLKDLLNKGLIIED